MTVIIKPKRSETGSSIPAVGDLAVGELAVNTVDKKIYIKNSSNVIIDLTSVEGTAVLSTGETGGSKFLRENGAGGATWVAIPGGGDALTANPLSQFAATTSSQLAGVISDETGSGALVFGTTPTLIGLKETSAAIGASDIDMALGNHFTKTISGTTTLTVSNVPTTGNYGSFILDLTNGGSATVNWWSGVKWAAGTAPTLTAAGRDVLGFYTYDGGTIWTGLVLGKDVK